MPAINLSALYLNLKRLLEIIDSSAFDGIRDAPAVRAVPSHGFVRAKLVQQLESAALEWLQKNNPPTLGELLTNGGFTPGVFFTHYGTFWGKNIINATLRYDNGKPIAKTPYIWTKLDSCAPDAKLHLPVHPENLTSVSAPEYLSGQKRLFVFARAIETEHPCFMAQTYVIGHLHDVKRGGGLPLDYGRLQWHMEVFPLLIDNFKLIQGTPSPSKEQLEQLKNIPEKDIKTAFAEIIGEPYVPKDWGGEKSDLFSTNVSFAGRIMATAFAFKGPAIFRPLTVADLGKNGDQISRLFSEPADLVILQHCHAITTAVRDHMRAFATRIGRLRPFTLIDGADTVRILAAYKKCGF